MCYRFNVCTPLLSLLVKNATNVTLYDKSTDLLAVEVRFFKLRTYFLAIYIQNHLRVLT